MTGDRIPIVETYRGVGVHDCQPPERVATVKAEIDAVLAMSGVQSLYRYAEAVDRPPECRLLAAAKVEAAFDIAAEERRERPSVDLDRLSACVAGLDSVTWRDPSAYCTLFDPRATHGVEGPRPVPRETPLPEATT
jgi:hypothetical protein